MFLLKNSNSRYMFMLGFFFLLDMNILDYTDYSGNQVLDSAVIAPYGSYQATPFNHTTNQQQLSMAVAPNQREFATSTGSSYTANGLAPEVSRFERGVLDQNRPSTAKVLVLANSAAPSQQQSTSRSGMCSYLLFEIISVLV